MVAAETRGDIVMLLGAVGGVALMDALFGSPVLSTVYGSFVIAGFYLLGFIIKTSESYPSSRAYYKIRRERLEHESSSDSLSNRRTMEED